MLVTNFGDVPAELPAGEVVLASTDVGRRRAAANATVWVRG